MNAYLLKTRKLPQGSLKSLGKILELSADGQLYISSAVVRFAFLPQEGENREPTLFEYHFDSPEFKVNRRRSVVWTDPMFNELEEDINDSAINGTGLQVPERVQEVVLCKSKSLMEVRRSLGLSAFPVHTGRVY